MGGSEAPDLMTLQFPNEFYTFFSFVLPDKGSGRCLRKNYLFIKDEYAPGKGVASTRTLFPVLPFMRTGPAQTTLQCQLVLRFPFRCDARGHNLSTWVLKLTLLFFQSGLAISVPGMSFDMRFSPCQKNTERTFLKSFNRFPQKVVLKILMRVCDS